MIGVRVDKNLEARLEKLAKETGRSKSYYMRKALEAYLEAHEAYHMALAKLEKGGARLSLEQLQEALERKAS